MLQKLTIENYALIRSLDIEIESGFSVITGETGAGKSILLGALSLILGQRADTQVLWNKEKKCIVEAVFQIQNLNFEDLFVENDLDKEVYLVIRREITPAGKSRAFINDTPVSLNVLKEFTSRLVDIHSQHQTLTLQNSTFQLKLLDGFVSKELQNEYAQAYKSYKKTEKELYNCREQQAQWQKEQDYMRFLFEELSQWQLKEGEQEEMEAELEALNHAEQIKQNLYESLQYLQEGSQSIVSQLDNLSLTWRKIISYYSLAEQWTNRLQSVKIELKDIANEIEKKNEELGLDPEKQSRYTERLDAIYRLQSKHQVKSIAELNVIEKDLDERLLALDQMGERIQDFEKEWEKWGEVLSRAAHVLHEQRVKAAKDLQKRIMQALAQLGMSRARLEIEVDKQEDYFSHGSDKVNFLFNANVGGELKEIAKVASGGELSRLMLAIKSVIHGQNILSTILFDEIDTGVSGEIAGKVGEMMKEMSQCMQVIAITHLPQIAAKAKAHYRVSKKENEDGSLSQIQLLDEEGHLKTIAGMMSGKSTTQAAMEAAKELINEK